MRQTATLMRFQVGPFPDQYGNPQKQWVRLGEFLCRLEPWKGREYELNRDTVVSYFRVYFDSDAAGVVRSQDRIIVDDVTYEIGGQAGGSPNVYRKRARINHVEAIARLIEG
jgi:hypothetical protein